MPAASRNLRGSAHNRRQRRLWVIEQFGIPRKSDGEKTRIACFHCGCVMRAQAGMWEIDRFPVCGHDGGRYVVGNIVPACKRCNATRCKKRPGCREWPYLTC